MDLKIRSEDSLRISCDHDNNNFIDVKHVGYESMAIDLFCRFQYIEIRKKETQIRVFTFPKNH